MDENVYDRDLDYSSNTVSIHHSALQQLCIGIKPPFEFGQKTDFFDGESNYIKVMQTMTKAIK